MRGWFLLGVLASCWPVGGVVWGEEDKPHFLALVPKYMEARGVPSKVIVDVMSYLEKNCVSRDYTGTPRTAGYRVGQKKLCLDKSLAPAAGECIDLGSVDKRILSTLVENLFHESFHAKWEKDGMAAKMAKDPEWRPVIDAIKASYLKKGLQVTDAQAIEAYEEAIASKFGNLAAQPLALEGFAARTRKAWLEALQEPDRGTREYFMKGFVEDTPLYFQDAAQNLLKVLRGPAQGYFDPDIPYWREWCEFYGVMKPDKKAQDVKVDVDIGEMGRAYIERELLGMTIEQFILNTVGLAAERETEEFLKNKPADFPAAWWPKLDVRSLKGWTSRTVAGAPETPGAGRRWEEASNAAGQKAILRVETVTGNLPDAEADGDLRVYVVINGGLLEQNGCQFELDTEADDMERGAHDKFAFELDCPVSQIRSIELRVRGDDAWYCESVSFQIEQGGQKTPVYQYQCGAWFSSEWADKLEAGAISEKRFPVQPALYGWRDPSPPGRPRITLATDGPVPDLPAPLDGPTAQNPPQKGADPKNADPVKRDWEAPIKVDWPEPMNVGR